MWIAKSLFFPAALCVFILNHQPFSGPIVEIFVDKSSVYIIDGDELIVKGNYYDILSEVKTPEGILYTCVDDQKETNFHHTLKEDNTAEKNTATAKDKLKQSEVECWQTLMVGRFQLKKTTFEYSMYKQQNTRTYNASVFIPPRVVG